MNILLILVKLRKKTLWGIIKNILLLNRVLDSTFLPKDVVKDRIIESLK